MADRSIMVRLGAVASGLKQGLKEASDAAKKAAADIEKAGQKADQAVKKSAASASMLSRVGAAIGRQVGKVNALAEEVSANREHIDRLGTSAVIAGGLIAAGVGIAAKKFADFDQQMSNVEATGAEARVSLSALRETAIKLGADTMFSATEAAQGIENMLKAGVSAKDVLAGGLKGALDLAAAGQLSVADSAEIAATALTQFKLSGSQMGHVADLLAAGAGKAQGEVSDLALALKYVGPVAAGMGISLEETVGALSAFASQGVLADQAGTSLRGVLAAMTSPSTQARKEIDKLGISLYDNQGAFMGLSNVAGQLKKAYAGLTDAERDMSLGILFGNQQVTAARVLFGQGAEGIDDWTSKVNDAGYAARAAATRMDNLKGDVEKLSGAVDSALIQSGSGLNEMLRGMTQRATDTVNAVGQIPSPVLEAGARMAAFTGIGLLATGMLLKGTVAFADYRESLKKIGDDAPRTGKALKGVTAAGKALGIAFAALQVASIFGSAQQAEIDKARASIAEITASLTAMSSTSAGLSMLDDQFRKIQSRFFFWETGSSAVKGVGDALKQLDAAAKGNGFQRWMDDAGASIAGLAGAKTPLVQLKEELAKTDQALSSMDPERAAQAFDQISQAAVKQGLSIDDVVNQFPLYKAALQSTATALGVTTLTSQDYADWMGHKIPVAITAAANSNTKLAGGLTDLQADYAGVTDSMKDYETAMWAAADAALKLSGAEVGYRQAVHDANKEIKEGKGLNTKTQAGRTNQRALNEIVSSGKARVNSLIDAGETKKAAKAMKELRTDFINAATAAGVGKTKAKEMADALNLIPEKVDAQIHSTLDKDGVNAWNRYKPAGKTAWITPKLSKAQLQAHVNILIKTGKISADGNLFAGRGLVPQRFADGGYPSIGSQSPQIRAAGGSGLTWAEQGAGPWEAFISGNPKNHKRSLKIWEETGSRLGVPGFADGGVRDYAALRAAMGAPGGAQVGTQINVANHYPQAEPTSVTINKAQQYAAALGRH